MGLAFAGFLLGILSFTIEYSMGVEVMKIVERDNCLAIPGDHDKVCKNAFAEHWSLWQAMFTALPQEKSLLGALGVAVIAAIAFIFQKRSFLLSETLTIRQRQYPKLHPSFLLFNFLRTLFSQGILNPKVHIPSTL